jgi:hypothetical protein
MREKASAAKKKHPSTPYPLRSRCSRPLPISVRPCLPSSSRWLSSFARRHPPLPAVVVAPALVPGPSASALACRQRPLVVVALALVPCPSASPSPAVVVALALILCPSASALACRRCRAGSRPWPVGVRPRLPSAPTCRRRAGSRHLPVGVRPRLPSWSRRLSSLARRRPLSPAVSAHLLSSRWLSSLARQRPPSPAVVVALALVLCPSASALACRRCRAGSRPWPVGVCPRLPSAPPCRRCAGSRPLPVSVRPRLPSSSPPPPPTAAHGSFFVMFLFFLAHTTGYLWRYYSTYQYKKEGT